MKKTLTTGLFAVLFSGLALAAPISPEQARQKAADFESKAVDARRMRKARSTAGLNLVYTRTDTQNKNNLFYVFTRGNGDGCLLMAADDRLPAVIGYSDSGTFDTTAIPPAMQGMMESWSAQISALLEGEDMRAPAPVSNGKVIAPLLGDIMWDQGDPYNRKCPTVTQYNSYGEVSGKGPAATGCVATAIGQIMYYYQWPETGTGSVSYVSKGEDDTVDVNVTFEGTQYQWDKMLPGLDKNSPAESIDAVSTLLFHVGAGLESIYGASTGATDVSVAPTLVKYFGYDKGVRYLLRDYYTAADWNDIIINEFENGRPIAYGGLTKKWEGHFFVLDGIDADGYYHVNWGWSGMENGYYLLTLLEPGQQGIGGAGSGTAFYYGQNMIAGICKPVADSQLQYNFTAEYLTKYTKTISRSSTAKLKANEVWNNSANDCTASLGFALYDAEGNIVHRQFKSENASYPISHGTNTLSVSFLIPDDVVPGTYTVRPVYSIDGLGVSPIQMPPGRADRYVAEVTEDKVTYSMSGAYALSITGYEADTETLKSGETKKITLKLHNNGGEFYGPVQLRVFIKGKERVFGTTTIPKKPIWVNIPGECDSELTFDVDLNVPGSDNYVLRLWGNEGLWDEDGYHQGAKNLSSIENVKIEGPALPPVLSLADDMIITTAKDGIVPRNNIGLRALIENEGGSWEGVIQASIWDLDSWSNDPVGYITFDPVALDPECEQWVELSNGELPENLETGKVYEITLRNPVKDEAMVPSYYNSIEITFGDPIEKKAELSLAGVTFDPSEVVAGQETTVKAIVSNAGFAYDGKMNFIISREGETVHTSAAQSMAVPYHGETEITFNEVFELPTADDYIFTLLDGEGNEIGSKSELLFTADEPRLSIVSHAISPDPIIFERPVDFTFAVLNEGFRFEGPLHFIVLSDKSDEILFTSDGNSVEAARGETVELKYNATLSLDNYDNYIIRLLTADDVKVGEIAGVSSTEKVGIDTVTLTGGIIISDGMAIYAGASYMEVYSVSGSLVARSESDRVDISKLARGLYVLRAKVNGYSVSCKIII